MAELSEPNHTGGQEVYPDDSGAVGTNTAGLAGEEGSDSDDYDPSITAQEEPAPSLQTSDQKSIAPMQKSVLSPETSTHHPLPPRPIAQFPVATDISTSTPQQFATTSQPKMRGGFEVDEDDDDDDGEEETDNDSKDILDVYEAVNGSEVEPASNATAPENAVDSLPPSAKQANGVSLTAHSLDASTSTPGVVSSAALPTTVAPQRATTATPVTVTNDDHVQASPISNVNKALGLALPKGRLAHDVVGILEDRIKADPRGDIDAWLELMEELKSRNKQEEVRGIYERFLKVFPYSVSNLLHSLPGLY